MGNESQVKTEWPDVHETRAGFNPFPILWQRKALVLLGLVVGLLLGGLYYARATTIYEAKAQVLVVKKRSDDVTGMDTRHLQVEDYVATHREIIRSQLVIERAIKKYHLDSLDSFAGDQESLTDVLIGNLQITRHKGPAGYNNVLDLALRTKVPEEAAIVLNAVIDSYKDFLDDTYHNMSDSTLDLVKKARDDVLKDLTAKEAAYRAFRVKSPFIKMGKEGNTHWQDRLTGIEAKRVSLLLGRTEIEGQLTAIENARKEGLNRETILALMASLAEKDDAEGRRHSHATTMQDQLSPLLAEEQKLAADYGPNHPQLQTVRQEIARVRAFYASPSVSLQGGKALPSADPVEDHVQYLRQQLKHIQNSERLLAELFDRERSAAKKFAGDETLDEAFRTDIARLNQLYDGIVKQLQSVQLVREVGGYEAKIINSPAAGKKISPKGTLIFPAAALLGLLLGCGLAGLVDRTDKSFRGADEIRRTLGLPVVGYIPRFRRGIEMVRPEGKMRMLDSLLSTSHYAKSAEAEAYRAVRTALYFSSHGQGRRIIQITSAGTGEGKSTLAANLAICIAQSGKKVMLIDADLRQPRIHRLFGVSADIGLASVLNGEVEAAKAIQESGVPGLWLLPSGVVPPNPAELLTSPRFEELLSLFRTQYDFVIVDTPPLLEVTDPGVVASRVDGVLLAIRMTKSSRPRTERAGEILKTLGAAVVGVVVNEAERVG